MNRRSFLKSAATGLALAAGGARVPPAAVNADLVPVAFLRHSGLPDQSPEAGAGIVRQLVDESVRAVTRKATAEQAWKSLFRPDDVVAVKVNCMAGMLSPSPDVLNAVVEGLKTAGVDPDKVTIYDKEDRDLLGAGYELRYEPPGPLLYGTVGGPQAPGYNPRFTRRGTSTFRITNILSERTTAIVNVPVVKDHVFAGITGALKNHFGSIHNPEDYHYLNGCSPAVAEVNLAPDIRGKQRLIVGDALRVQYEGGPSYQPDRVHEYHGVFAGLDPVAIDSQLLVLIDTLRQENGLPLINETDRPVRYLEPAAEKELGALDPSHIELIYADLAEALP